MSHNPRATWALERDAMMAHPIATLQFVNQYRGYALAYTLGRLQLAPILGADVPTTQRWVNLRSIIQGESRSPDTADLRVRTTPDHAVDTINSDKQRIGPNN